MRSLSFSPVGANNPAQLADFGDLMTTLGIDPDAHEDADFARQVARVEVELLWVRDRGLPVPAYVTRAFREAVELARERAAA